MKTKAIRHRDHGNNPKAEYVLFHKSKGFATKGGGGECDFRFKFDLDSALRFTKVEVNRLGKAYLGKNRVILDKLRVCPVV